MTAEDRSTRLLMALSTAVEDLQRYASAVPRERLETDRDAWRMVRQALQEAIQASIDLAHVLLARAKAPPAQTYRAAFAGLRDALDLPADQAEEMADAAGLRNVLVHVYTELDLDRVHAAYTGDLPRLERFLAWAAAAAAGDDADD